MYLCKWQWKCAREFSRPRVMQRQIFVGAIKSIHRLAFCTGRRRVVLRRQRALLIPSKYGRIKRLFNLSLPSWRLIPGDFRRCSLFTHNQCWLPMCFTFFFFYVFPTAEITRNRFENFQGPRDHAPCFRITRIFLRLCGGGLYNRTSFPESAQQLKPDDMHGRPVEMFSK